MEQRPDAKAALAPSGQVTVELGPRLIGSLYAALHLRHDLGVGVVADQQLEIARREGPHMEAGGIEFRHGYLPSPFRTGCLTLPDRLQER